MEGIRQQRYEVIGSAPRLTNKVGYILHPVRPDRYIIDFEGVDTHFSDTVSGMYLDGYPNVFKPLKWYERRTNDEMPQYVKGVTQDVKDKVFKVKEHKLSYGSCFVETDFNSGCWIYYGKLIPSTESEYLTFKATL